jgi:hypothetical protein
MATLPAALPSAPPMPPQEQAQMGGGPPGIGSVANAQAEAAANPNAQLMARANAIDAVLKQMAELNTGFAPFARQASSAIMNGLAAISSAPQVDEQGLPPEMPGNAPPGAGMNPTLA